MSKKQPINNDGENLIKGIGERLKRQHDRKPMEDNKDSQPEKDNQQNILEDKEEEKSKKLKNTKNDWNRLENGYKTTYTVTPKMEVNYDRCRIKFRKELRTLLSKQDAIELGFLLLRKIDDDLFEKVRKNFSPEDDPIEALKTIIKRHY